MRVGESKFIRQLKDHIVIRLRVVVSMLQALHADFSSCLQCTEQNFAHQQGFQVGGYHAVHLPGAVFGNKTPLEQPFVCFLWLNTISTWREDSLLPSSPSFLSRISDAIGRSMSKCSTRRGREAVDEFLGLKVFLTCFSRSPAVT